MGPYAFGFPLVLAAIIIGRAIMEFLVEFGQLRTRQTRIEYELDQRVAGLPEKRAQVDAVAGLLPPLKRKYQQLRAYYGAMRDIELEMERRQLEQSEEAQAEARKDIDVQQRQRRPEDFNKTIDRDIEVSQRRKGLKEPEREIDVQQRRSGWENL